MEHDCFGLNLTIFNVDLVAAHHDRDVLAHSHQITMPVRHIFVCDTRCDVKHDDGTLALNVIAVTQTAKFLLAGRVPDVESNGAPICVEHERMHFDAQRGHVLLLEFTGHVTFDERCLAGAAVTDQHTLECGNIEILLGHFCG